MRPLIVAPGTKEEIAAVIEHARKNPYIKADIEKIMRGATPVGDQEGFTVEIPFGFKAVYSVEEHPIGWCHHISISVERLGSYPHERAALEIIKLFGIDCEYGHWDGFWIDEENQAINFVIKIKEENRQPYE